MSIDFTFSKLIKEILIFKWLLNQIKVISKTFSGAIQIDTYIKLLVNTGWVGLLIEFKVILPRLL